MTRDTLSLIVCVVLAFGLSRASWCGVHRRRVSVNDYRFQLATLPGTFSPAVAAVLVRAFITREGSSAALFVPRITSTWPIYLVEWLLPIVIAFVSYVIIRGTRLRLYASELKPIRVRLSFLEALPFIALATAPFQFGEEFGWRVYFQSHLLPGVPLLAAAITGRSGRCGTCR